MTNSSVGVRAASYGYGGLQYNACMVWGYRNLRQAITMDCFAKNKLLSRLFYAAVLFADLSPYIQTYSISTLACYSTQEEKAQKTIDPTFPLTRKTRV